jgi:hypothetical protein
VNAAPSVVATAATGTGSVLGDFLDSLARIPQLIGSIPDLIRNPGANPTQAMLVIGILVILVLLIIVAMVLLAVRAPRRASGTDPARAGRGAQAPRRRTLADLTGWSSRALTPLLVAALVLGTICALLVVTGIASSDPSTCLSCHSDMPHAAVSGSDPHAAIDCVACHEGGGPIARATVNAFPRFQHFLFASQGDARAASYGLPIASDSCATCHGPAITGIFTDPVRGLKVSHAEPLAAGAECVDCHPLRGGAIAASGAGMDSCLRCHGSGNVSAECDLCHTGDPAIAARAPEATGTVTPSVLVPEPRCDPCHLSQKSCDSCHGIRMPHTASFKLSGHARQATIDIWDNGGRMCRKCHTAKQRPCTRCHSPFPAHPTDFRSTHQAGDPESGCNCHQWDTRGTGKVFCQLCHPTR